MGRTPPKGHSRISRRTALAVVPALVTVASLPDGRVRSAAAATEPPSVPIDERYRLVFSDEFERLDIGRIGHKWTNGYRLIKNDLPSDALSVSGSVLTITGDRNNISTCYEDASGGTFFRGGYFEARIWSTNWTAFWMMSMHQSLSRPTVARDPMTWAAEIDIIETDETTYPVSVFDALHKNTGNGGGVKDDVNHGARNGFDSPVGPIVGQWHNFSALITPKSVDWFVDGVRTLSCASYESTWQPMALILGVGNGGVVAGWGSPAARAHDPAFCRIDWVRVWQLPGQDEMIRA